MTEDHISIDIELLGPEASAAADRAVTTSPVVLTRGGLPVAALVSIDWLENLRRDRQLLQRLALGELESAAGDGIELDAVLEDCRLLLEES